MELQLQYYHGKQKGAVESSVNSQIRTIRGVIHPEKTNKGFKKRKIGEATSLAPENTSKINAKNNAKNYAKYGAETNAKNNPKNNPKNAKKRRLARTAEYLNYFTDNTPALMTVLLTEEEVNLRAQEIIQHHRLTVPQMD
jgi:hypothetical protein